jgi:hypothetical protein
MLAGHNDVWTDRAESVTGQQAVRTTEFVTLTVTVFVVEHLN